MITQGYSQSSNRTFVLVHPQWHGAWVWNKVMTLLESNGSKVVAFDLPGQGDDPTSTENVTMDDCVQKVVAIANAQTGPVILVGHSSSGVVIAQASEYLGKDKVASLVFLDAFLPNNGESVLSLAEKFTPNGTPLGKTLSISNDHKIVSLDTEKVAELLYNDCSLTDIAYAKSRLRPGPLSVLATPVRLTEGNYGSIAKFYILCNRAKDMEKTSLAKNAPCKKIFQLPSGHSPFFSMPNKLVAVLDTILHEDALQNLDR